MIDAVKLIKCMRLVSSKNDNVPDNVIVAELTACLCDSGIDSKLLQKCGLVASFDLSVLIDDCVDDDKLDLRNTHRLESVPHDRVYYFYNKPAVFRHNVLSAIPMMSEADKDALSKALTTALRNTACFASATDLNTNPKSGE